MVGLRLHCWERLGLRCAIHDRLSSFYYIKSSKGIPCEVSLVAYFIEAMLSETQISFWL